MKKNRPIQLSLSKEQTRFSGVLPFVQMAVSIVAVVIVSLSCVCAQKTSYQDSLKQLLRQERQSDEVRVKAYIGLAKLYTQNDFEMVLAYTDSALVIAKQSQKLSSYLPELFLLQGYSYRSQSKFEKAFGTLQQGLEVSKQQNDSLRLAKLYEELGICSELTSELVTALAYNQQALDIYTARKDTAGISSIYNSFGIIYRAKKEYEKAMGYFKKALTLNETTRNKAFSARLINNIGLILQDLNRYDSALVYFQQALSYLDCSKQKFGCALINNNLGICYRNAKQYSLALDHFQLAKDIQTQIGDEYGLALVNDNISRVYFAQNKFNESLTFLKMAVLHAEKSSNLDLLHDINNHTAATYEKLKNFPLAYYHQKESERYLDSLHRKSLSKELAELEVKYQVKQQQAANELLKAENNLSRYTIKNKNLVMITSIVFSVLVLTLLILAYRALRIKQKASAIIKEKNEELGVLLDEIAAQKKSIELQKDEIAKQNGILSEKNQYLQELNHEKNSLMGIVAHDLKAPLNSIGSIAYLLPQLGTLNKEQKEIAELISKIVASSGELIRDLIDLSALENKEMKTHPELISIGSIVANTHATYQSQALNKGISLILETEVDENLKTLSDGKHVERVLQNLVSNAVKFSNAGTQVVVGTRLVDKHIQFYVKDEGPGISLEEQKLLFKKFVRLSNRPTAGESSSGLGLSISKALMDELGGSIYVQSELSKGTTFICSLPMAAV